MEIERLEAERNIAVEKVQQHIDYNASVAQDQDKYQQRYDELAEQYQNVENALLAAQETLRKNEARNDRIESFIEGVEALPESVTEFRADYWGHLVDKVMVNRKGEMVFTFSCGVEIQV